MSKQFPNGVAGHVVSMTRRYEGALTFSVASCECGWTNEVLVGQFRKQDAEVDAHWAYWASQDHEPLPTTDEEWQELVDSCDGAIAFESARAYGLVAGGPEINVERCQEFLRIAKERGYEPSPNAPERFVAMLMIDSGQITLPEKTPEVSP